MGNSNKLFFYIFLSLYCFNASAEQRLYKIELLIFSQDMPTTEAFDQSESHIKWPQQRVDLSVYRQVNSQSLSLNNSAARLARSQNYQPIMHVAWIQPVKSNSLSRAVKITNAEASINGFFRMQRGHLLHMIVDLEYSKDSVIYRLNEKRRFKLNETHYFDNPKFGVIARVSPIGMRIQ